MLKVICDVYWTTESLCNVLTDTFEFSSVSGDASDSLKAVLKFSNAILVFDQYVGRNCFEGKVYWYNHARNWLQIFKTSERSRN